MDLAYFIGDLRHRRVWSIVRMGCQFGPRGCVVVDFRLAPAMCWFGELGSVDRLPDFISTAGVWSPGLVAGCGSTRVSPLISRL